MPYHRDAELNRLVSEINRTADAPVPEELLPVATPDIGDGNILHGLLTGAIERNASDVILIPGAIAALRINGSIVPGGGDVLTSETIRKMFASALSERMSADLQRNGSVDFSVRLRRATSTWRFRVNLHRQRGELAASLRVLPPAIPSLEDLGLPQAARESLSTTRGLILICGPTGSGKSTTLAAMVDLVNRERSQHVVTIEDPIEYEHANDNSLIEQIEIGRDAPDFSSALRSVLRQNPDVILLGEMRDHDTISTAVTAAETGHLILSTLHTSSAAQAIHRIIDVFPASQQAQIRSQLALALHAVICQQLIPRADGKGRVLAVEILLVTDAIRNHIRRDSLQHVHSEITMGRRQGMMTMEQSLASLVASGAITREEAQRRATRSDELESLLKT